jgi:hypothetical protein
MAGRYRAMTDKRRELYRSANGDAWFLVRDASGRVYVDHEPNEPSGGQSSRLSVGAFLARGAAGPEHQALTHLIGALVDDAPAAEPQPIKTA